MRIRTIGWASVAGSVGVVALLAAPAVPAGADTAKRPQVRAANSFVHSAATYFGTTSSYTGAVLASGGATKKSPDDITTLGGDIFVGYQNGINPDGTPGTPGGPTNSLVAEYHPDGLLVNSWQVAGKADGLTADAANNRLIVTVNEDANSSLYTIHPFGSGTKVFHLNYSPATLSWGGGTDAPRVDNGHLFIAASAPSFANSTPVPPNPGVPALIQVTLDEQAGTASWTSALLGNETANNQVSGMSQTLSLTDPDSVNVVPSVSAAFAGQFAVDSQGDGQLVFVNGVGTPGHTNSVLQLPTQIDDFEWATASTGTLYAVDSSNNKIVEISGTFTPGTVFVAVPSDSSVAGFVGTLDLATGNITPITVGLGSPKGLLFVPGLTPSGPAGYRMVASDGGVFNFGDAPFYGSTGATKLNRPMVAGASTSDRLGYWLAASDGGVFNFGDAGFFGSLGATRLNQQIVAFAPTPEGAGYWLVGADGGVFSFGDAGFFGSLGASAPASPIVAVHSTLDGKGYWLVGANGVVYPFGDAENLGGLGGLSLSHPIVGFTPTPDGLGYWLVTSDGAVFSFGDAKALGDESGAHLNKPIVAMKATADGQGYWLTGSDGGVFTFGDAGFFGSTGGVVLNQPVVALTS